MIKIGITGSIASGKSTVAKMISGKKYPIFDADYKVREIYKKKFFIKKLYKAIGAKNKKDIKNIISINPQKLKIAEKIIHPMVRKELNFFIKKNKKNLFLIFEIPLLIESKLMNKFHKIIFVNSKRNIRKKRFLRRGKSIKLFNILDRRQDKPAKKIKFSDHVINNNNSLKRLKKNVKLVLNKL
tara:strand:+ start:1011 stop:1562 length:552 start_codon:yes stop_codon:yes gene_type:complete